MRPIVLFVPITNHGLNVPDDVVVQAADCAGHRIMVWPDRRPQQIMSVDKDGSVTRIGEVTGLYWRVSPGAGMFASEKVAKHEAERHARLDWAPQYYDMTPDNPASQEEINADRAAMNMLQRQIDQVRAAWRAERDESPAQPF